ncbi:MAG: GNAT family N-acetyltransferase [Candidatus Izemoplasmatales bacterium]
MPRLRLVVPAPRHRAAWRDYLNEWNQTGEGMTPWALDPCGGDFDGFLAITAQYAEGRDLPPNKVRSGLFLLFEDDAEERLLGAVSIRYELNDYLLNYGGHVGYGVRPSERRKGRAKAMLSMALPICRKHGIGCVLVTCDTVNVASARTIMACGGKLENEVIHPDGSPVQRYWIEP